MKSDEEFIAGIYEKAEKRRAEAGEAGQERGRKILSGPGVRRLAAAACLCVLGCAAIAAAAAGRSGARSGPEPYSENRLVPASAEGGEPSRTRSAERLRTVRGTVAGCGTEEEPFLQITDAETGREFSAVLRCEVEPEKGDEVILVLNEEQDGYYLTDAARYYRKDSDGLYYNAQGSVFSENAGGE